MVIFLQAIHKLESRGYGGCMTHILESGGLCLTAVSKDRRWPKNELFAFSWEGFLDTAPVNVVSRDWYIILSLLKYISPCSKLKVRVDKLRHKKLNIYE